MVRDVAVEIPAGVLAQLGPSTLLALAVLMILTGRLVSAKERDYWRNAFFEEQRQKRDLMVTGRVQRDVLRAVESKVEEVDQ